jgi:rfaE bifunctional protein nucleotidyltransferase chain/domain
MEKTKLERITDKIVDRATLQRRCAGWKMTGQKIVFTNGCFDLLHEGHIRLLAEAAQLGHKLVVGLNTDSSVSRLKGPERPLNKEASRALVMASQLYVDSVCLFEEDTPLELIQVIRPDMIVKGGDYSPETVVGADFVKAYGGAVVIVPTHPGFSTTGIIASMK